MKNIKALFTKLGAVGLAVTMLTAGSPALGLEQAPAPIAETAAPCVVEDATLTWGTLERWRSYVSGSIAKGGWELEGAEYEMPNFVWQSGSGIVDSSLKEGFIDFSGAINFSGHDDLLQVSVKDPVFYFGDTGYLLLSLSSTKMTGEPDIDVVGETAVEFDLAGHVTVQGQTVTVTDAPGVLTAAGAAAFGGFYDAGEPVDALNLTATLAAGCDASATGSSNVLGSLFQTDRSLTSTLVLVIAGVGILGSGVIVALRLFRRRD